MPRKSEAPAALERGTLPGLSQYGVLTPVKPELLAAPANIPATTNPDTAAALLMDAYPDLGDFDKDFPKASFDQWPEELAKLGAGEIARQQLHAGGRDHHGVLKLGAPTTISGDSCPLIRPAVVPMHA